MKSFTSYMTLVPVLATGALGIDIDFTSRESVNNGLSSIAYDMMQFYTGNLTGETPGLLPGPCIGDSCYYWWEDGSMWGNLINYQQYTGDTTYQANVLQALAFQIGPDKNYNPPNQTKSLTVDDQAFWAFAALEAAEAGIPNIDDGTTPSWIELADAVFNFQTQLWDPATCSGGVRWQVYSFNAGYNLKTLAANAALFQLSARLARYTGNSTYADWANKVYDWIAASSLYQAQDGTISLWDNTNTDKDCTDPEKLLWTYNYGSMLLGSAMMYNHTNGNTKWKDSVTSILNSTLTMFFPETYGSTIMTEIECEQYGYCNNDQSAFKASLSRWMAVTSIIAPFTYTEISTKLRTSAEGAARQCSGGDNGRMCGREWYSTTWDGSEGVGQQMSALAIIGATQMMQNYAPVTLDTNVNVNGSSSGSSGTATRSSSLPGSTTNGGGHVTWSTIPMLIVISVAFGLNFVDVI